MVIFAVDKACSIMVDDLFWDSVNIHPPLWPGEREDLDSCWNKMEFSSRMKMYEFFADNDETYTFMDLWMVFAHWAMCDKMDRECARRRNRLEPYPDYSEPDYGGVDQPLDGDEDETDLREWGIMQDEY